MATLNIASRRASSHNYTRYGREVRNSKRGVSNSTASKNDFDALRGSVLKILLLDSAERKRRRVCE